MSEVKYRVCDIEGCENKTKINVKIQVKFHTEQTEGRNVKPYLSMETIDICEEHYQKMLEENKLINAYGAQGYNQYYL